MGAMGERKWVPISHILVVGKQINELLTDSRSQYETFLPIKANPTRLDTYTVNRIKKLFTERIAVIQLHEEQVTKWRIESTECRNVIDLLEEQIAELKRFNQQILELAEYLGRYTIDKIMAMSDAELAMRILVGEIPLPQSSP